MSSSWLDCETISFILSGTVFPLRSLRSGVDSESLTRVEDGGRRFQSVLKGKIWVGVSRSRVPGRSSKKETFIREHSSIVRCEKVVLTSLPSFQNFDGGWVRGRSCTHTKILGATVRTVTLFVFPDPLLSVELLVTSKNRGSEVTLTRIKWSQPIRFGDLTMSTLRVCEEGKE